MPRACSAQFASRDLRRGVLSSGSVANGPIGQRGLVDERHDERHLGSASSFAGLPKYARLAASMPYCPRPKYGMFTYLSSSCSRGNSRSIRSAMTMSPIFSISVDARPVPPRRCLAICIVSVDAPEWLSPSDTLDQRPDDRALVDALVGEEILVLGRENRADEQRRNLSDAPDQDPALGRGDAGDGSLVLADEHGLLGEIGWVVQPLDRASRRCPGSRRSRGRSACRRTRRSSRAST